MAKLTEQIGYIRGLIGSMQLDAGLSQGQACLRRWPTRWKASPANWAICATI